MSGNEVSFHFSGSSFAKSDQRLLRGAQRNTHVAARVVQPRPVRARRLIMQESAACHMKRYVNLPISSAGFRWRAAAPSPAPSRCAQPSESSWKIKCHIFTASVVMDTWTSHEKVTLPITFLAGGLPHSSPHRIPFWVSLASSSAPSLLITSCIYPLGPGRTGAEQARFGSAIKLLRFDRSAP